MALPWNNTFYCITEMNIQIYPIIPKYFQNDNLWQ